MQNRQSANIVKKTGVDLLDLTSQVWQRDWENKDQSCREMLEEFISVLDEYIDILESDVYGTFQMLVQRSGSEDQPIDKQLDDRLIRVLLDRFVKIAKSTSRSVPLCQESGDDLMAELFIQITAYIELQLQSLELQLSNE